MKNCSAQGCARKHYAKGWCSLHYARFRAHDDALFIWPTVCSVDGCGKPAAAKGFCSLHYSRFLRHGDPLALGRAPDGYGTITSTGYRYRQVDNRKVAAHILVAEKALGKPLRPGVEVHHVDENKLNNDPSNLVICTRAYHRLIHQRMNALAACGNADWKSCGYCKQHDEEANLYKQRGRETYWHRECENIYRKKWYRAKRLIAA